jgi:CHAT domain-containing protein/tetratricopeptide (TPR) repeat protein
MQLNSLKYLSRISITLLLFAQASFSYSENAFSTPGHSRHSRQIPSSIDGLVVESLPPAAANTSGLIRGDVLYGWHRGANSGTFYSPFDFSYIEVEQGARGHVYVEGFRNGKSHRWTLKQSPWGIRVRPTSRNISITRFIERNAGISEDPQKAIRILESSSESQERKEWLSLWLITDLADQYAAAQRWEEASNAYRMAIERARGAKPEIKGELFLQWARVLESHDDLIPAEQYYRDALGQFQRLNIESVSAASVLSNIGVVLLKQGNLPDAEAAIQEALIAAEKLAPGSKQVVVALVNLAVIFQNRGDLALAENYYQRALRIEVRSPNLISQYSLTLTNIGTLRFARSDPRGAEHYFRSALSAAEQVHPDSLDVATVLADLSHAVLEQGRFRAAQRYAQRALTIRERNSPGALAVALSFLDLGKISKRRNDWLAAERYYREALRITKQLPPPHPEVATALRAVADLLILRGDLVEAEAYSREAISIIEKESPTSIEHAEATSDLASILRLEHNGQLAAQLFQQALLEFDSLTGKLGGAEQDLLRYRAEHQEIYKEYIQVLVELGRQEEAFEASEASRARVLADVLAAGGIQVAEKADPLLFQAKRDLRNKIRSKSEYRIRLLRESDKQQYKKTEEELRDLAVRYNDIEAQIGSGNLSAATFSKPLSLLDMQALLDPDSMVLEYSLGNEASYLWLITQDSFTFFELPARPEIELAAKNLYGAISKPEPTSGSRRTAGSLAFEKAATHLADMVLQPAATLLSAKRLLVVPDGLLQYVPFSALPSPRHPAEPLIVEHEIVNLPSVSVLKELREAAARRPPVARRGSLAVLADPVFDNNDLRVRASHNPSNPNSLLPRKSGQGELLRRSASDIGFTTRGRLSLPRLMYARREAESILAAAGRGEILKALDFKASLSTAMDPSLGNFSTVHFATHGLVDSVRPEFSGLLLSLVDERGSPQDGFLGLEDIYSLNLPVDLVVLSACQTALGKVVDGEGLLSLTRGFMHAGASRVVASLWSVNDLATSELMAKFYRIMQEEKVSPARALRKAQIEVWKQKRWRSPYYWAAFQIQGEWN